MKMIISYLILAVLCGCCNREEVETRISNKLDIGDLEGAIDEIDSKCGSSIHDINVTKFLLLYRLGMQDDSRDRSAKTKAKAIDGLIAEEIKGSKSAMDILNGYRRMGEMYFEVFPWQEIIGPGRFPEGSTRGF